ncbi:MAG: SMC family ATPase, partial [Dactylosporangium sp.]|nr:SMC family ATPase [Dactylosporangium sp.]
VSTRRAGLDASLATVPEPATLRGRLESIDRLRGDVNGASEAVRSARTAQRTAASRTSLAEDQLRASWKAFDAIRDALASLGPPGADRDDLSGAWTNLTRWAGTQVSVRERARAEAVAAARASSTAVTTVSRRVADLLTEAGIGPPGGDGDPGRTAVVALERAEADHRRLVERQAEAEELRASRGEAERQARVARALTGHLRADRFERWLLAEALDTLVGRASSILRQLSGDQYDLGSDKGEFFVIDHHDAGLRRAVRTLSGGETFQASLALALALSEQLAGASTAAASLESILLDEGFGTLDASTLESVATTLEHLAARGDRMVGVVTHVGALAERIPVRFEVHRDARSARVERAGS